MSEALQTSIFKLRDFLQELDDTNRLKKYTIDLKFLRERFLANNYLPQKLNTTNIEGYDLELFYSFWPSPIKWKEFISPIVGKGEIILDHKKSYSEGYILLISMKKSKTIYAIAGGFGYLSLQLYCDNEFGLDILSRLIKTDDKVLKAVKERNFTGGVLGSSKYFRGDYNLNENESFGNFYHELTAKLNTNILKDKFGFSDAEVRKGNVCLVKNSFTLKKAISLKRSISLIKRIELLLKEEAIVDLNLVKKLSKGDTALIKKLNEQLRKNLYAIYRTKHEIENCNVEICHKDFDKFYDAENYNCHFRVNVNTDNENYESLNNFKDLIPLYKKQSKNILDFQSFEKAIDSTFITSSDSIEEKTRGWLIDHICTEISADRKSYFLFNKEWYLLKSDLQIQLNNQCQEFITSNTWTGKLQRWKTTESENDYNAKHIGEVNTLVFDKICPQNIEVCDIMKWTNDEVQFIHVKKGFDNEMRNLCRQVHIAARKIKEDIPSGRSYLVEHYNKLNKMIAKTDYFKLAQKQLNKTSQDDYINLFDSRKPIFVLAVLDGAVKQRSLNNVSDFESNIAKFCLHGLAQDMRVLNVEFKIIQIERL